MLAMSTLAMTLVVAAVLTLHHKLSAQRHLASDPVLRPAVVDFVLVEERKTK
jgi:hypothetical protein